MDLLSCNGEEKRMKTDAAKGEEHHRDEYNYLRDLPRLYQQLGSLCEESMLHRYNNTIYVDWDYVRERADEELTAFLDRTEEEDRRSRNRRRRRAHQSLIPPELQKIYTSFRRNYRDFRREQQKQNENTTTAVVNDDETNLMDQSLEETEGVLHRTQNGTDETEWEPHRDGINTHELGRGMVVMNNNNQSMVDKESAEMIILAKEKRNKTDPCNRTTNNNNNNNNNATSCFFESEHDTCPNLSVSKMSLPLSSTFQTATEEEKESSSCGAPPFCWFSADQSEQIARVWAQAKRCNPTDWRYVCENVPTPLKMEILSLLQETPPIQDLTELLPEDEARRFKSLVSRQMVRLRPPVLRIEWLTDDALRRLARVWVKASNDNGVDWDYICRHTPKQFRGTMGRCSHGILTLHELLPVSKQHQFEEFVNEEMTITLHQQELRRRFSPRETVASRKRRRPAIE